MSNQEIDGKQHALDGLAKCSPDQIEAFLGAPPDQKVLLIGRQVNLTSPDLTAEEAREKRSKFATKAGIEKQVNEMTDTTGILYFLSPDGIDLIGWEDASAKAVELGDEDADLAGL